MADRGRYDIDTAEGGKHEHGGIVACGGREFDTAVSEAHRGERTDHTDVTKNREGYDGGLDDEGDSSDRREDERDGQEQEQGELRLKQDFGFIRGTSLVVGAVIGSGIFIFPQNILMLTGSVGSSLLVWAFGGLVGFAGVLTSAELGSVVGKSGAAYAYLHQCYGPLVAFLFIWTSVTIVMPSLLALSALTFARYLLALLPFCGPAPSLAITLTAATMIVSLALINSYGSRTAMAVQMTCTLLKLTALVVIVVGGVVRLTQGHTSELEDGFAGTTSDWSNVALAFYAINFSYLGWENIYIIFEEVKNPKRNLVLCGGVGLGLVSALYVTVNVSFLTAMTRQQLLASPAVALTWSDVVLGPASLLMTGAVVVSVLGSASSGLFAGARIMFAAGRDETAPQFFSYIHVTHLSPLPSILLNSLLALVLVLPADVGQIVNFMSLPLAFFQLLSNIAVFVLRRQKPRAARFITVPLVIPVLSIVYNLFLIITPVALNPRWEFLYACCFVGAGVLLYVPFAYFRLRPKLLDAVEVKLQLLLQVSPTSYQKCD